MKVSSLKGPRPPELLLHKAFGQFREYFQLVNLKIIVEKGGQRHGRRGHH